MRGHGDGEGGGGGGRRAVGQIRDSTALHKKCER